MATPHDIQDYHALQEHRVTELMAELQAIDDKARTEVQFYTVMDWFSQNDM
jgi:hypothetical protein